jgi:hypothetical protein
MRRLLQLSVLCLAAGLANACKPQEVVTTENIPTAGVRFIHAVPDTGAMDFRPVDIVENSTFYSVGFRNSATVEYKNARAGDRHFRIFMANTDLTLPPATQQAIASTVVKDTTYTLVAGHNYTFILWGFARTGSSPAMKLTVIDDNPADPGAQVALRLVNAGGSLPAVDGRAYPFTGVLPATATWAGVAPLTASAYVTAAPDSMKFNVQPAGGGAALFTDAKALVGSRCLSPTNANCTTTNPLSLDIPAAPGTFIAGSAVSGFVMPPSVAGSKATSFTTPGILFFWDRRPPLLPGT